MKDIKGFCKMYDISIPEFKEFEYYISMYKRIDRWKNIDSLIKSYTELEEIVGDVFNYKIKKSNEIIEYIKTTRTYSEMMLDNLIPDYSSNSPVYEEDKYYLSIDIISANWFAFKSYDPPFLNEMCDSYSELLDKFDVHESLRSSKQFRQYIFGNLNPRKQAKIQRSIIEDFIKETNSELEITGIKQDEVIFTFENKEDIEDIISNLDKKFKYKIFKIDKVKDFRINHKLDDNLKVTNSEIVGCNGNKYFIYLKQYIFKEDLDVRDLYFRMDKELAIWNVENLKVEIKKDAK